MLFHSTFKQDVPVMLFDLTAKDQSKLLYRDAATARAALETEGVEGSAIHWEYMPLLRRYENSLGLHAIMPLGQGGGSAGE